MASGVFSLNFVSCSEIRGGDGWNMIYFRYNV